MMVEVITDPQKVPFYSLDNVKISTVGKRFVRVSPARFRKTLRAAGANVKKYPRRCHAIVIVGDAPSLPALILLLRLTCRPGGPVLVSAEAFSRRYLEKLRDIELYPGLTFGEHFEALMADTPMD